MNAKDNYPLPQSGAEVEPKGDETFAERIDKNDPHKVEKLANAGKDTDAAEASE